MRAAIPVAENPGLALGTLIGELAAEGLDKLTFLVPESLSSLGMWLEQLLAESTGKEGKGILPVVGELPGEPTSYGNDRTFVYLELEDKTDNDLEEKVSGLIAAGRPVITIRLRDLLDLGKNSCDGRLPLQPQEVFPGHQPLRPTQCSGE